jgi:hypothetical protein
MKLQAYQGPDLGNCIQISTEKFPDGSGLLSFISESGAEVTMSVGRLIRSPDEWAKNPVLTRAARGATVTGYTHGAAAKRTPDAQTDGRPAKNSCPKGDPPQNGETRSTAQMRHRTPRQHHLRIKAIEVI